MHHYLKFLFLVGVVMCISSAAPAVYAQTQGDAPITSSFPKSDDSKAMKVKTWNTPPPPPAPAPVKTDESPAPVENEDTADMEESQPSATNQELWERYKALAENGQKTKEKQPKDKVDGDATPRDPQKSDKTIAAEKKNIMMDIVDNYKKSSQSKGGMASKSFGAPQNDAATE